jgi:hypothetical protein
MISLALAIELKQAGLVWQTKTHDFFAIPDHDMDERVFVLADMVAFTELVQGWPAVAFHGSAEWAMDYIFSNEIVWLPSEEQLRQAVVERLRGDEAGGADGLTLSTLAAGGYRCAVAQRGKTLSFDAPAADEAYAQALLHLLRQRDRANGV